MRRARTPASSERGPREKPPALHFLEARVPLETAEAAGALLILAGAGGVVHEGTPREGRVVCYGESRTELLRLAKVAERSLRREGIPATLRVARAPASLGDWQHEWSRHLEAVDVSKTLCIVPTSRPEPKGDAKVVRLEPAPAFGFGEHPTTRMAAAEVERLTRDGARDVLDFGAGSGVLALIAVASGAERAVGLDIDPAAVRAARANATLNGVERRCRFGKGKLAALARTFDLVVANVDAGTLLRVAKELAARVAASGTLLLTGLLVEDAARVQRAYGARGLIASRRRVDAGWALLILRRPAAKTPKRTTPATVRRRGSRTSATRRSSG